MSSSNLENLYYQYLLSKATSSGQYPDEPFRVGRGFTKLFAFLNSVDFYWNEDVPNDANREADALYMRQEYYENIAAASTDISYEMTRPVSVLEVMVAIADRCETHIMHDDVYGDRTGLWFWAMVDSLCIGNQYDDNFDEIYVKKAIEDFLERRYHKDGLGGLFYIPGVLEDMRRVEIWEQLKCYLSNFV